MPRAASNSFSRLSRWEAPEPISLTCKAILQPRRVAYSRIPQGCKGEEAQGQPIGGPIKGDFIWQVYTFNCLPIE
jgi:hypothetical protein